MGPLPLRIVERTDRGLAALVRLDAAEPYLNDHRPRGRPLFGTVLGIEAMAAVAAGASPGLELRAVEQHENHAQLLVADGAACEVTVSARILTTRGGGARIACELLSHPHGGAPLLHYRARFAFGASAAAAARRLRPVAMAGSVTTADAIYAAFFHGPAFRVVAAAQWQAGGLWSRMAHPPPALFACPAHPPLCAPGLVEFALQSAGLYALATDGAMRIPSRIGAVRYHVPAAGACPAAYAHVRPAPGPHAPRDALEIRVVDPGGRRLLTVSRYATVSMTAGAGAAALIALRRSMTS